MHIWLCIINTRGVWYLIYFIANNFSVAQEGTGSRAICDKCLSDSHGRETWPIFREKYNNCKEKIDKIHEIIFNATRSNLNMSQDHHDRLEEWAHKLQNKIDGTTKVEDLNEAHQELSKTILKLNGFLLLEVIKSPLFSETQNEVIKGNQKKEIDSSKSSLAEILSQIASMNEDFNSKFEDHKKEFESKLYKQGLKYAAKLNSFQSEINDLRKQLSEQGETTKKENADLALKCKGTHEKLEKVVEEYQDKFNQIQEHIEEIKERLDSEKKDSSNPNCQENIDEMKLKLNELSEEMSVMLERLIRL